MLELLDASAEGVTDVREGAGPPACLGAPLACGVMLLLRPTGYGAGFLAGRLPRWPTALRCRPAGQ